MHPQSLWQINPQVHPVRHCSFDQKTLICALTPLSKHPDMVRRKFFFFLSIFSFFFFSSSWNIKSIRIRFLVTSTFVILIVIYRHNWKKICRFVHQLMMHRKHQIDALDFTLLMIRLFKFSLSFFH